LPSVPPIEVIVDTPEATPESESASAPAFFSVPENESDELPFSAVELTLVPGLGESVGYVTGVLNTENPSDYRIITIIQGNDGNGFLKPTMDNHFTHISPDGVFISRFYTNTDEDYYIPVIILYFVPSDYSQAFSNEPGQEWAVSFADWNILRENSLLAVRIERF
jgi:hypothetical protein